MELKNDGTLDVAQVEVPGIIRDDYGNEWTVPTNDASFVELLTNPLALPKQNPEFHYQFVRNDQVTAKTTEGFRPVLREEVGVADIVIDANTDASHASYHQVHDLLLMKIPKVLANRRYKAAARMCNEAVAQVGDPRTLAQAGGRGKTLHQFTKGPEPEETEMSRRPDLPTNAEPSRVERL